MSKNSSRETVCVHFVTRLLGNIRKQLSSKDKSSRANQDIKPFWATSLGEQLQIQNPDLTRQKKTMVPIHDGKLQLMINVKQDTVTCTVARCPDLSYFSSSIQVKIVLIVVSAALSTFKSQKFPNSRFDNNNNNNNNDKSMP